MVNSPAQASTTNKQTPLTTGPGVFLEGLGPVGSGAADGGTIGNGCAASAALNARGRATTG